MRSCVGDRHLAFEFLADVGPIVSQEGLVVLPGGPAYELLRVCPHLRDMWCARYLGAPLALAGRR